MILVCDLNGAEEMMHDLFKGFLELIGTSGGGAAAPGTIAASLERGAAAGPAGGSGSASGMTKNIQICMADVLAQLIDECAVVPEAVLELLLAYFSPKAIKSQPAAHQLAVEVCRATEARLQKYIAQVSQSAVRIRASSTC